MTQFKEITTGRIYDFKQVLYCSTEVTSTDEWGDVLTVIIIDPSRHLAYKYKDVCFCSTHSDFIGVYDHDHGRGEFISNNDERYKAIINHFNLNEG